MNSVLVILPYQRGMHSKTPRGCRNRRVVSNPIDAIGFLSRASIPFLIVFTSQMRHSKR